MAYLPNILFAILLFSSIFYFRRNFLLIKRNILLGKSVDRSDRLKERWINMLKVALGQSKMLSKPISGVLHLIVYIGFIFTY